MNALAGSRQLVKLASRRDRIVLPIWLYVLIGLVGSSAYSIRGLYPDAASRQGLVEAIGAAPTAAAMYGKLVDASLGAITAWRVGVIGAVLASVMSIMLISRHTRAEEQNGRQELVSAGAIGRYAAPAAALQLVITANVIVAVCVGGVSALFALPAAGAFALGSAIAGCGLVFGALTAVTAQLAGSSRGSNGLAFAVLGICYLIRAAADMSTYSWLLWCSPVGWLEQVRAFAGDRWWVLALPVVSSVLLILLAGYLVERRDYGSGLLPTRPGSEYARADTRGVFGLAWRLHRGVLAGWMVGLSIMGAVFGSFAKDVDAFLDSARVRKIMTELGGGSQNPTNAYLWSIMSLCGLLAGAYAVSVIVRARGEEAGGRAEAVLAGGVSRWKWILSHLLAAAVGSAALLAVAGIGAGLADGLRMHDVPGALGSLLGAALIQWPAVFVVTAFAVLLFGLVPTYANAAWAPLGVFVFLTLAGPELSLSQAFLDLSPFSQLPKLPGAQVTAAPLVWIGGVGLVAAVAGLVAFRRRDVG